MSFKLFKNNMLWIAELEQQIKQKNFNCPAGNYKLWGLLPRAGKELGEYMDQDYVETLLQQAQAGSEEAVANLIYLSAVNAHLYLADVRPLERLGIKVEAPKRKEMGRRRYKARVDASAPYRKSLKESA